MEIKTNMANLTPAHIEKLRAVLVGCAHVTQDAAILNTLCDMASRSIAAASPLGGLAEVIAEYDRIVDERLDPRDAEADFVMRGSDWREIRKALSDRPEVGWIAPKATTPWDPLPRSAPVSNALVLKVTDYPVHAAEKVKGEVPQLQAGIIAMYEALREVGMQSVRFELLLRAVMQCDKNANILNGARDLRAKVAAELAGPSDMNRDGHADPA